MARKLANVKYVCSPRILVAIVLAVWGAPARAQMKVHYINVGQASSALLEFPKGAILIDAGGEDTGDTTNRDHLIDYLDRFFVRRADLNKILRGIVISHPHIDHTRHLMAVMERFTVKALIDGGDERGLGGAPLAEAHKFARARRIKLLAIREGKIGKNGRSNRTIDPFRGDPEIRVLSGFRGCRDENNDSLAMLVRMGQSRVLFIGDGEHDPDGVCEPLIPTLVQRYKDTRLLDVDVYTAGHHGSRNGTDRALLEAVTPRIAVMSAGHHSRHEPGQFHAFQFGHPRKSTVDLLEEFAADSRPQPKAAYSMAAVRQVEDRTMAKAVYCTCWDGDIVVSVSSQGVIEQVQTSQ